MLSFFRRRGSVKKSNRQSTMLHHPMMEVLEARCLLSRITEFPIPTNFARPVSVRPGQDGNIWFSEYMVNKIGRITPGGSINEFPIPTTNSYPGGIATAPDGNIWFTETHGN
jgi:streptogramin lyase